MKLKVAIGLIISVVFIYLTFHTVDLKQIFHIIANANYLWLIPAIALMLISHYLRALRWQLMIEPIKNVKITPLFSALMIGYAANNVFPFRAGEFFRAYAIGKSEKISTSSAFATVFVERFVLDFIPLLVILSIIFVVFASVLDERIKLGAYII